MDVIERSGISRAVREKNSIRLHRQNIFGLGRGRDNRGLKSTLPESAENIQLDAIVEGNDPEPGGRQFLKNLSILEHSIRFLTLSFDYCPGAAQPVLRVPFVNPRSSDLLD